MQIVYYGSYNSTIVPMWIPKSYFKFGFSDDHLFKSAKILLLHQRAGAKVIQIQEWHSNFLGILHWIITLRDCITRCLWTSRQATLSIYSLLHLPLDISYHTLAGIRCVHITAIHSLILLTKSKVSTALGRVPKAAL